MHAYRTTAGQALSIAYDPVANTVTVSEIDWCPDPIRSTATPVRSRIVRRLGPALRVLGGRKGRPRTGAKAA